MFNRGQLEGVEVKEVLDSAIGLNSDLAISTKL